jgi:predicted dehydrogenase
MVDRGQKVRWGILGCGKIAHKFAHDLLLSDNAELVACASRESEKSRAFAEKYGVTLSFDSYENLANCTEVDVIYVATPNSYHKEHSILCLQNKKAVLCEKPLSTCQSDVEEMIQVARENNVFLMEAMWTSFLPNILSIENTIQKGTIGEIIHLSADFAFRTDYNPKSRLFDANLGGGSLLDIGIYTLFMSVLFLGKPKKMQATLRNSTSGVDTSCSVLLSYEEEKTATLFSSFETSTNIKCEIYGTEGSIIIANRFHEQSEHTLVTPGKPDQLIQSERVGFGYFYEIEHVNECLYNGWKESPRMPFKVSLDLIQIMDEIRFASQ